MKLLVATSNAGKLREFSELLAPAADAGLSLVDLRAAGLPSPAEDGRDFAGIAALKARAGAQASGLWTLADDSGLCVDALGGRPGILSARYAEGEDEARRQKLLAELAAVLPGKRGAQFRCALALVAPDGVRLFRAEGTVAGSIAPAARGAGGFGYDPIFEAAETPGRTIAELPQEQKNALSHRGRAVQRMLPLLIRLARAGDLPR